MTAAVLHDGDDHDDARDPDPAGRAGRHAADDPVPCPRAALSRVWPARRARPELRLRRLFRAARGRLRPRRGSRRADPASRSPRGRPGIWRYLELLPVAAAPERGLAVGSTALVRADRLGRDLGLGTGTTLRLKDDTRNPDPLLQGPGRRRRHRPSRRVRLRHPRLRLDRQPGRRDRRGGRRDRPPGVRLRPGRPRAGQGRARPELRRDGRPGRRHVRRHQPPQPRDRRRGGLGFRQRQPPAVLRRGQQDDRVRDRRAARLAPAGRPGRADRVGLDVHEDRQGLRRAGGHRPGRAQGRPVRRRPAGGLLARRDRVRRGRRRDPAGPDARHDRPVARDRLAGRRRLRAGAGAPDRRLDRVDPGRCDGGGDPAGPPRTRGSSSRRPAA